MTITDAVHVDSPPQATARVPESTGVTDAAPSLRARATASAWVRAPGM